MRFLSKKQEYHLTKLFWVLLGEVIIILFSLLAAIKGIENFYIFMFLLISFICIWTLFNVDDMHLKIIGGENEQ